MLVARVGALLVYRTTDGSGRYVVADRAGWLPGAWLSVSAALDGADAYLDAL